MKSIKLNFGLLNKTQTGLKRGRRGRGRRHGRGKERTWATMWVGSGRGREWGTGQGGARTGCGWRRGRGSGRRHRQGKDRAGQRWGRGHGWGMGGYVSDGGVWVGTWAGQRQDVGGDMGGVWAGTWSGSKRILTPLLKIYRGSNPKYLPQTALSIKMAPSHLTVVNIAQSPRNQSCTEIKG